MLGQFLLIAREKDHRSAHNSKSSETNQRMPRHSSSGFTGWLYPNPKELHSRIRAVFIPCQLSASEEGAEADELSTECLGNQRSAGVRLHRDQREGNDGLRR